MNNFASLDLCEKCSIQALNDQTICTPCKEQWTGDSLPEQFAPKDVTAQLLKEIRDHMTAQDKREGQARRRGVAGLLIAACAVGILFFYLHSFLGIAGTLSNEFTGLATQVSSLVTEANAIAVKIDAIDLQGIANTSQEALAQTSQSMALVSERITALDIDSLNESIQDLAVIVSPLAALLGGRR